ncbi:hypothetical protein ACP70R_036529 [Stipagrostis hirtigluma subsp. patula]
MALATPAAVVLELMKMGQQSAAHLGDLLRATAPQEGEHHELAAEILRCCGRVIAALTATGAGDSGKKRKAAEREQDLSSPATPPKRRARGAEPSKVVKSGTVVDGFIWRKYGQKDINGRDHPRLYYRCAYADEGCGATRRVQRTQGGPMAYEIAYYGEHTCRGAAACQGKAAAPPPAVVDFGSNAAWGCGSSPAASSEQRSWDGEVSQGWSSSSASSEVGFEVQAHEWHDTGAQPSATPCHGSPVLEFLDGCFDWESILNDSFDFGGLHHAAALQY